MDWGGSVWLVGSAEGLLGEFGRGDTGKFFLLDDALGFVGIDRVAMLMGALFGLSLLWFERGPM